MTTESTITGTESDTVTDAERAELARRQTELLAALVAGGPVPEGFDPARLRVQSWSLAAKRRDGVSRTLPVLATALGERWPRVFMEWARTHPKPETGGSRADTLAFVEHLRDAGELPDEVEAALGSDAESAPQAATRKRSFLARIRARLTHTSADRDAWDPDATYCSD